MDEFPQETRLVVIDARGAGRIQAQYAGPRSTEASCIDMTIDAAGQVVAGGGGTGFGAQEWSILKPFEIEHHGGYSSEESSTTVGRAGPGIAKVVIAMPAQPQVTASLENGWYLVWRPGSWPPGTKVVGLDSLGNPWPTRRSNRWRSSRWSGPSRGWSWSPESGATFTSGAQARSLWSARSSVVPRSGGRGPSTVALVLAFTSPLAELAGILSIPFLDRQAVHLAGVALVLLGIAGSVASQVAMGASWRADVDPDVGTELVTTGPFRLVRNPVLTATASTILGLALMVPNVLGVIMVVLGPGFDADPGPLGRGAVPEARPRRSLPTVTRGVPAASCPASAALAPEGRHRARSSVSYARSAPVEALRACRGLTSARCPPAARCRQSASGGSGEFDPHCNDASDRLTLGRLPYRRPDPRRHVGAIAIGSQRWRSQLPRCYYPMSKEDVVGRPVATWGHRHSTEMRHAASKCLPDPRRMARARHGR